MFADVVQKLRIALFNRRHAYRETFKGPYGQDVLKDLARFCRAHDSTFAADPRLHAMLEGRREVWLRLQHHLQLPPEQLWELYDGRAPKG